MKRSARVTCFLTTVVVLFGFSLSSTAQAQQKTIALNYSNFLPGTHLKSVVIERWCKEVEKRTNGLVKITVYHGGILTPASQAYDGVVKGLSDLSYGVFGYSRGRFPLTEFADLPLGVRTGYVATKMLNEYYKKFKPREMDDVKVMYLSSHGPGILHTVRKPVHTLDDLKGMKIRVTGNATPTFKALGAIPVAMPMGEAYDALSKNIVEGINCDLQVLEGFKLHEVLDYTTESFCTALSSGFFIIMNKGKWESIPPDTQKIIEKVNEEWIEIAGKSWEELDEHAKKVLLKGGHKFITLSDEESERWKKAVSPVIDDYVKSMRDKGLPGDEVLKFAMDYLKEHQKQK
jgi:TRAP-type C4-dicarboxylate transport system substrate-binding protein